MHACMHAYAGGGADTDRQAGRQTDNKTDRHTYSTYIQVTYSYTKVAYIIHNVIITITITITIIMTRL